MTNLTNLLQQLSELDPATCRLGKFGRWEFGPSTHSGRSEYRFGFNPNGTLYAMIKNHTCVYKGRPALAWLRDAVEAACEARGWDWRIQKAQGVYFVQLWETSGHTVPMADGRSFTTPAEALLAAFVEAVRAEKRGK